MRDPMLRRTVLLVLSGAALLTAAACDSPAPDASSKTQCQSDNATASVVSTSATTVQFHVTGTDSCGAGSVDVIAVRVDPADGPVGPGIANLDYVVLWTSTDASFSHTFTSPLAVDLLSGEHANLAAGSWDLLFRQSNGSGHAMPMPKLQPGEGATPTTAPATP
jgi:hypothetical protein